MFFHCDYYEVTYFLEIGCLEIVADEIILGA